MILNSDILIFYINNAEKIVFSLSFVLAIFFIIIYLFRYKKDGNKLWNVSGLFLIFSLVFASNTSSSYILGILVLGAVAFGEDYILKLVYEIKRKTKRTEISESIDSLDI